MIIYTTGDLVLIPVNNNIDDLDKKQGEVNDLTKSISQLSIDENSDLGIATYDNKHLPSKNEYTEYKTENDNTWNKGQFISCAGKATWKFKHCFNVLNLENNSDKDIDCKQSNNGDLFQDQRMFF